MNMGCFGYGYNLQLKYIILYTQYIAYILYINSTFISTYSCIYSIYMHTHTVYIFYKLTNERGHIVTSEDFRFFILAN